LALEAGFCGLEAIGIVPVNRFSALKIDLKVFMKTKLQLVNPVSSTPKKGDSL
jgi:hypothetical protein